MCAGMSVFVWVLCVFGYAFAAYIFITLLWDTLVPLAALPFSTLSLRVCVCVFADKLLQTAQTC